IVVISEIRPKVLRIRLRPVKDLFIAFLASVRARSRTPSAVFPFGPALGIRWDIQGAIQAAAAAVPIYLFRRRSGRHFAHVRRKGPVSQKRPSEVRGAPSLSAG